MFETQQTLRDEIAALKLTLTQEADTRRGLEHRIRELDLLPAKVTELTRENAFATKLADEATLMADKMKDEMIALKEEGESYKRLHAEAEAEKNRYRDQSVRNHELVRLLTLHRLTILSWGNRRNATGRNSTTRVRKLKSGRKSTRRWKTASSGGLRYPPPPPLDNRTHRTTTTTC